MHLARKTLVAVASAVAVLGASAAALAANGHPAVTAGGVIHGCRNNSTHVMYLERNCPRGYTAVSWNEVGPKGARGATGPRGPQGPSGVVASGSTTLQDPASAPQSIATGGSFVANSTGIGTVTLPGGTYLITFNAKATPNDSSLASGAEVFPEFFIYNQPKNPDFTGDLLNIGTGALEPAATNHDSYYSGVGQITVPAGGETLYVYAFGYDSDSGAGTYALDSAVITATRLQTGS